MSAEPMILQLLPAGVRGPTRIRVVRARDAGDDQPFRWMVAYRGALRWHRTFADAIANADSLARTRGGAS